MSCVLGAGFSGPARPALAPRSPVGLVWPWAGTSVGSLLEHPHGSPSHGLAPSQHGPGFQGRVRGWTGPHGVSELCSWDGPALLWWLQAHHSQDAGATSWWGAVGFWENVSGAWSVCAFRRLRVGGVSAGHIPRFPVLVCLAQRHLSETRVWPCCFPARTPEWQRGPHGLCRCPPGLPPALPRSLAARPLGQRVSALP